MPATRTTLDDFEGMTHYMLLRKIYQTHMREHTSHLDAAVFNSGLVAALSTVMVERSILSVGEFRASLEDLVEDVAFKTWYEAAEVTDDPVTARAYWDTCRARGVGALTRHHAMIERVVELLILALGGKDIT